MLKLFTKKHGQKGFTLIELLVVIAIIGILASIVLASLNTARKKSRDARRIADLNQIRLAQELYFDSTSPNSYADLSTQLTTGCGGSCIAPYPIPPTGSLATYPICIVGVAGAATSYTVGTTLELAGDKPSGAGAGSCVPAGITNCSTTATDYCVSP